MISTLITFFKIIFTMKNLSLFSLLVMIGMVLFMGGCAKDEINSSANPSNNSEDFFTSEKIDSGYYVKISEVNEIERYYKKFQRKYNLRSNYIVDTSRVFVKQFTSTYKTYSMYIESQDQGKLYNMVFTESNGVLSQPNVIEMHSQETSCLITICEK